MQRSFWKPGAWKLWAAAALSAGLLELPFPLAGPMPAWRSVFAWFALVPLLWAVLSPGCVDARWPLRRAFLLAYLCGFLWYAGNCNWVRDTMSRYGDMPPLAPTLLLIGYSLVLGLYFGFFGLGVALVRRATGSTRWALAAAPILWAGLELAASRITSVPWDQLGYSQVDNGLVNQLAPWTGVYGISFVLVFVNALLTGGLMLESRPHIGNRNRTILRAAGVLLMMAGAAGVSIPPPQAAASATAVLVQPNLDVSSDNRWPGQEWDRHMAEFAQLAGESCNTGVPDNRSSSLGRKSYIAGIPQTGAPTGEIVCPPYPTHPDLVVWPESPAPFEEQDPRFQRALASIARQTQAPLVVGNIGSDFSEENGGWHFYNSALVVGADGARVGRYDKIHLVPFGEYVPFQRFLTFARKLTGRVSSFTRGTNRKVFILSGQDGAKHRYGVFICYEAVFADEVRQFARLGAEVLVNISDDGWYGDTSAAWQHLNMARMRAIENRRWLLRDTNTGVTAVIDPYGRVRQSIPRHAVDALPAGYGFRDDITFYTAHGDVFGWLCAILGLGIVAWAAGKTLRASLGLEDQPKVRS
jgi:apolipoprotein N-acyltransferase